MLLVDTVKVDHERGICLSDCIKSPKDVLFFLNSPTDEEEEKKAKAALEGPPELKFRVPPVTAIAGVLISEWAYGRAGPQPGHQGQTKL